MKRNSQMLFFLILVEWPLPVFLMRKVGGVRQPQCRERAHHTLRKMFYLEEADATEEETPQMVSMIVMILGRVVASTGAGQEVKVQRNRCRCGRRANCRQRTISWESTNVRRANFCNCTISCESSNPTYCPGLQVCVSLLFSFILGFVILKT